MSRTYFRYNVENGLVPISPEETELHKVLRPNGFTYDGFNGNIMSSFGYYVGPCHDFIRNCLTKKTTFIGVLRSNRNNPGGGQHWEWWQHNVVLAQNSVFQKVLEKTTITFWNDELEGYWFDEDLTQHEVYHFLIGQRWLNDHYKTWPEGDFAIKGLSDDRSILLWAMVAERSYDKTLIFQKYQPGHNFFSYNYSGVISMVIKGGHFESTIEKSRSCFDSWAEFSYYKLSENMVNPLYEVYTVRDIATMFKMESCKYQSELLRNSSYKGPTVVEKNHLEKFVELVQKEEGDTIGK